VIVDNFHLTGALIAPLKTDPPLIVYADRMLPFAVSRQFFKSIPRRYPGVVERHGGLEDRQFSLRNAFNIDKAPDAVSVREFLSIAATERFNHKTSI
jgi:hypothetical protein